MLTERNVKFWLAGFILLFVFGTLAVAVLKYRWFMQGSDLALFEQTFWNTAQGRLFETSLEHPSLGDTTSQLAVDLMLFNLFIVPFYVLFPSTYTLLFIQTVAVGLGAVPVYLLAKHKLRTEAAALIFAVAYLLHPYVIVITISEFQPRAFAMVFLLATLEALEKEAFRPFLLFLVLLLLCRTDVALVVIMLGVYAFLARKPWPYGVSAIAAGAGWFILGVLVLVPYLAGGKPFFHFGLIYSHLGRDAGEIIRTVLTRPGYVLSYMFTHSKIKYILLMFVPLAFLPLLSPRVLLLTIPTLVINLLSEAPATTSIYGHYQALLIPPLLVATISAVHRIGNILWARCAWCRRRWNQRNLVIRVSLLTLLVVALASTRFNSIVSLVRARPSPERIAAAEKMISLIPPDAPVSAYSELLSHLSHRRYLYYFPQGVREPRNPSPEYVCADTWTERPWEKETIRAMLAGHRWKVVAEEQGYILFRRASSPP
ncbi:MAG: DUF2079 domain-containing protein [Chloroflexia bacterium]